MKVTLLTALLLSAFAMNAQAQEENQSANTTTKSASELQKPEEKQKDIDEEITNARMRATLGAKSKFSFKSTLGYTGSTVERPFDSIRPNYRKAVGATPELAAIGGGIGMNVRLTERDNLSVSTGVSILAPQSGDLGTEKFADPRDTQRELKRIEVSGLGIGWSRGYRAFGMQMISSASTSISTTQDSLDLYNSIAGLSLSQTVLADLGKSKWQAGAALLLGTNLYNGAISTVSASKGFQQLDYAVGIYPFAEYVFTDRYSFRTVFGYFDYNALKGTAFREARIVRQTPYQSMGIGISLTRDIYLYPNVQFVPEDVRPERTNVALSTNINL